MGTAPSATGWTMMLGEQVADLSTLSGLPEDAFQLLLSSTFEILLGQTSEDELLDQLSTMGIDALDVKRAFSGLSGTMLTCARAGLQHSTVGEQLTEAGLSADRSAVAAETYAETVDALRSELRKTTFGNDRIVGLEWRVDYSVKSRYLEKLRECCYIITIITEAADGTQQPPISFTCDVHDLTELVGKLQDARNQVGRLLKQRKE